MSIAHTRRVAHCPLGCATMIRWSTRTELRTRLSLHLIAEHGYYEEDAADDALILVPPGGPRVANPPPIDARLRIAPDLEPRPVRILYEERYVEEWPRPADWPERVGR